MPQQKPVTIFHQYYHQPEFIDRFTTNPERAVDVIIPIIHSNELWAANLNSIFREIPVNRLLLGDGGCIDSSIETARKFPRVTVFDHRKFTSLGFSLRKLMEAVGTPWFVYLHSDVYLPPGWFDGMVRHQSEYDWFECRQHLTVQVDYPMDYTNYDRPLSGSQMGRREAFHKVLPTIEDDYLYRNEDIIYANLLQKQGFRYGRADDVFHYHQMMNKDSAWSRKIKGVTFDIKKSPAEERREFTMQVKGIIKYTEPNPYLVEGVKAGLAMLDKIQALDWDEFRRWVAQTNPVWQEYIQRPKVSPTMKKKLIGLARRFLS